MAEIEKVRDNFIKTCTELRVIANGYLMATSDTTTKLVRDVYEKTREAFETTEQGKNQAVRELFTGMRDTTEAYFDNRDMPLELFHTYFVQAWHSFLDNIFEVILKEHFAGLKSYHIRPITIEFRSLEDTPDNLADNIRERVLEYFNNKMSSDEKLAIITQAQNIILPDVLKSNIRKHVLVRNIFQHNRGQLRIRDLRYLQNDELKYPCIEGEEQGDYYNPNQTRDYHMKVYRINDLITIDAMVLDQVYYDLTQAARLLIP